MVSRLPANILPPTDQQLRDSKSFEKYVAQNLPAEVRPLVEGMHFDSVDDLRSLLESDGYACPPSWNEPHKGSGLLTRGASDYTRKIADSQTSDDEDDFYGLDPFAHFDDRDPIARAEVEDGITALFTDPDRFEAYVRTQGIEEAFIDESGLYVPTDINDFYDCLYTVYDAADGRTLEEVAFQQERGAGNLVERYTPEEILAQYQELVRLHLVVALAEQDPVVQFDEMLTAMMTAGQSFDLNLVQEVIDVAQQIFVRPEDDANLNLLLGMQAVYQQDRQKTVNYLTQAGNHPVAESLLQEFQLEENRHKTLLTLTLSAQVVMDFLDQAESKTHSWLGRGANFLFPEYSLAHYLERVRPQLEAFLAEWERLAQTGEYETSAAIFKEIQQNGDLAAEGHAEFDRLTNLVDGIAFGAGGESTAVQIFLESEALNEDQRVAQILEEGDRYLLTNGSAYGAGMAIASLYAEDPVCGARAVQMMQHAKSDVFFDGVTGLVDTNNPLGTIASLGGEIGMLRLAFAGSRLTRLKLMGDVAGKAWRVRAAAVGLEVGIESGIFAVGGSTLASLTNDPRDIWTTEGQGKQLLSNLVIFGVMRGSGSLARPLQRGLGRTKAFGEGAGKTVVDFESGARLPALNASGKRILKAGQNLLAANGMALGEMAAENFTGEESQSGYLGHLLMSEITIVKLHAAGKGIKMVAGERADPARYIQRKMIEARSTRIGEMLEEAGIKKGTQAHQQALTQLTALHVSGQMSLEEIATAARETREPSAPPSADELPPGHVLEPVDRGKAGDAGPVIYEARPWNEKDPMPPARETARVPARERTPSEEETTPADSDVAQTDLTAAFEAQRAVQEGAIPNVQEVAQLKSFEEVAKYIQRVDEWLETFKDPTRHDVEYIGALGRRIETLRGDASISPDQTRILEDLLFRLSVGEDVALPSRVEGEFRAGIYDEVPIDIGPESAGVPVMPDEVFEALRPPLEKTRPRPAAAEASPLRHRPQPLSFDPVAREVFALIDAFGKNPLLKAEETVAYRQRIAALKGQLELFPKELFSEAEWARLENLKQRLADLAARVEEQARDDLVLEAEDEVTESFTGPRVGQRRRPPRMTQPPSDRAQRVMDAIDGVDEVTEPLSVAPPPPAPPPPPPAPPAAPPGDSAAPPPAGSGDGSDSSQSTQQAVRIERGTARAEPLGDRRVSIYRRPNAVDDFGKDDLVVHGGEEGQWQVLGYDQDGYVVVRKVGGLLSRDVRQFSEHELSIYVDPAHDLSGFNVGDQIEFNGTTYYIHEVLTRRGLSVSTLSVNDPEAPETTQDFIPLAEIPHVRKISAAPVAEGLALPEGMESVPLATGLNITGRVVRFSDGPTFVGVEDIFVVSQEGLEGVGFTRHEADGDVFYTRSRDGKTFYVTGKDSRIFTDQLARSERGEGWDDGELSGPSPPGAKYHPITPYAEMPQSLADQLKTQGRGGEYVVGRDADLGPVNLRATTQKGLYFVRSRHAVFGIDEAGNTYVRGIPDAVGFIVLRGTSVHAYGTHAFARANEKFGTPSEIGPTTRFILHDGDVILFPPFGRENGFVWRTPQGLGAERMELADRLERARAEERASAQAEGHIQRRVDVSRAQPLPGSIQSSLQAARGQQAIALARFPGAGVVFGVTEGTGEVTVGRAPGAAGRSFVVRNAEGIAIAGVDEGGVYRIAPGLRPGKGNVDGPDRSYHGEKSIGLKEGDIIETADGRFFKVDFAPAAKPVASTLAGEQGEVSPGPVVRTGPLMRERHPTSSFVVRSATPAPINAGNVRMATRSGFPDGSQLTFEMLQQAGLEPRTELNVEGRNIWISQFYDMGSGRCAVIAYVRDDSGSWVPRTYYRSASHTAWKLLSHYVIRPNDGKIILSGKGHGQESIAAPISVQAVLHGAFADQTSVPKVDKAPSVADHPMEQVIVATCAPKEGGLSRVMLTDSQTGEIPSGTMTMMTAVERVGSRLDSSLYQPAFAHDHAFDPRTIHPGAQPGDASEPRSFSTPEQTFTFESTLYGTVTAEVFTSADGNYRYIVSRDKLNRVWVSMEFADASVSAMGVHNRWIDLGHLGTPAFEHGGEVPGGRPYENRNKWALGEYVDAYDRFLRHIPIIQRYHVERGIPVPTSAELGNTSNPGDRMYVSPAILTPKSKKPRPI